MNQILVTDKVIITPDFKRKKRTYKSCFFLSLFTACTLFSCCIYAEYDRNKSEQVSQDMLIGMNTENTMISEKDNALIETVDTTEQEPINLPEEVSGENTEGNNGNGGSSGNGVAQNNASTVEYVAPDGISYHTDSVLSIAKLGIEYPVLSASSEELLKISLNKLWGPNANEVGNYVIVGHNYKNGKMFGKLSGINIGDRVELKDNSGRTITYEVYTTYMVDPADVSCTSQKTNGRKEVTLITCNSTGSQRFVVKAKAV